MTALLTGTTLLYGAMRQMGFTPLAAMEGAGRPFEKLTYINDFNGFKRNLKKIRRLQSKENQ